MKIIELRAEYRVSQAAIDLIATGKRWGHLLTSDETAVILEDGQVA